MHHSRTVGLSLLIVLLSIFIVSCGSSESAAPDATDTPVAEQVEQAEPADEAQVEADDQAQQADEEDAAAGDSDQAAIVADGAMGLPALAPVSEEMSGGMVFGTRVSTSWLLDYMGEDDARVEPLADTHLSIGFMPQRYGGDGGCNFFSGVYSQDGANVILETPATTGNLCQDDPDLLRQENTFMSLLATSATYNIVDGMLKLYSSEGQQLLTFSALEPVAVEGTEWDLRYINAETQWEEIIPGSAVTLALDGNQISGNSGCNEYGGEVVVTDDGYIQLFASTMTNQFCEEPAGIMDQEQLYIEKLSQAGLIRYFPTFFQLLDSDGMPLLLFSVDWQENTAE